jgi:hypothetical protein
MTLSRSSVAVRGLAWSRSKKRRKSSSRFRSVTTFERKHGGEKAVFERPSRASSSESGVWRVPRRFFFSFKSSFSCAQKRAASGVRVGEQSRAISRKELRARLSFGPSCSLFSSRPPRLPLHRLGDRRPRHRRRGLLPGLLQRGGNDLRAALSLM